MQTISTTRLRALPLAMMCAAMALNGATYYVATNGNDANTGSLTAPFLTVQRGVNAAAAGDTVIVRNGTYQPPASAGCSGGNGFAVNIAKAGASGAWITIKGESRGGVTLDGAACHSSINLGSGAAYVAIEDLVVRGGYWGGIWSNQNAHDIRIAGNRIEYVGNRAVVSNYGIAGVYTNSSSHNFTITGNVIHHVGRTSGDYMWHDHGLYVHGNNYAITNNVFYSNTSGWAICPVGPMNNVLIANNTFAFPNPIRDGHIAVGDGAISNMAIRNNIFYRPTGAAVVNCVVTYSGTNSFDNNLVFGASQVMGGDICGGGTSGLGTIAQSKNSFTDPQLTNVSVSPYDFRPKQGSPAIDSGVLVAGVTADMAGTPRPQGAAYDLGSYEYISGGPAAPPVISAVGASSISTSGATITWTTDVASDSQVQYGVGNTSTSSPVNSSLVTSHSITLSGLTASTTYTYRVVSKTSGGLSTTSANYTFTTAAPTATFSFTLSASPASLSAQRGLSAATAINATLSSGSAQAVTFSASGLPSGVTAAFSPASCTVNCSTNLTLSTTTAAAVGAYTIAVNGTGGGASAATSVQLTIVDTNPVTYYVAPTGSDSNPGSSAQPFLTVQRAVDAVKAGDTIIVRNGVYAPPAAAGCAGGSGFAVNIDKSGSSSAWITLKAESKRGATLDGQDACHSVINLGTNAAYWVIQDLRLIRGAWSAIWSNNGADRITVQGNEMAYIGRRAENSQYAIVGSYANYGSSNLIFDGNLIHDIGRTSSTYSMAEDQGLYLASASTTIVNNVFHQPISGWGVRTDAGFSGLIANNTFHGAHPTREGQMMLAGAHGALAIRNNLFNAPRTQAITSSSFTAASCATTNNTVSGSGVVLAQPAGCTTASNQAVASALLKNTASEPYDFRLQAGSPAIDKGVTLAEAAKDADAVARPQGAAFDAGAFESTAVVSAAPTISGVTATGITYSGATINWTTNLLSDSKVEYGIGNTATATPVAAALVTSHSMTLSGLSASTTYTYRVVSKTAEGASTTSSNYTFTTPAAPAVFSFSLAATPSTLSVTRGQAASTAVRATLLSGTAQSVTFRVSGLPSGVTVALSPATCTVTCTTTLTVTASTSAVAGNYAIEVAAGTTVTAATTLPLTITEPSLTTWGLAARWKLDEGKGVVAYDGSTYKNDGLLLGGVSWFKSRNVVAASLSGNGDFIQVNESPSLQMSTDLTVTFWISPDEVAAYDERVVAKVYSWDVKLQGANRYPQFTAGGKYAQLNYALATNRWQHVAITFSKGQVKGYVNGVAVGLSANSFLGGETLPQEYFGLRIGTDSDNTMPMKGRIGDVRVYGKALSAQEVTAVFGEARYN